MVCIKPVRFYADKQLVNILISCKPHRFQYNNESLLTKAFISFILIPAESFYVVLFAPKRDLSQKEESTSYLCIFKEQSA